MLQVTEHYSDENENNQDSFQQHRKKYKMSKRNQRIKRSKHGRPYRLGCS